jgi:phospholipase/carboxylesterase
MPTQIDPYTIFDRGWVVRIKPSQVPGSQRVLLLLHGWTGDENVMWVFTRSLPPDYWIISPRGPVQAPSGYGWAFHPSDRLSRVDDFQDVIPNLLDHVDGWLKDLKVDAQSLNLMGFSQGAALAYSLLISRPDRILKTAALAGFLPEGSNRRLYPDLLAGKEVFIAHGSRDVTVPVEEARNSAKQLEAAGASVIYCEDNTGHKLSVSCQKGLTTFFT